MAEQARLPEVIPPNPPNTSRQRFITRLWRRPPKSSGGAERAAVALCLDTSPASLENAGICSHLLAGCLHRFRENPANLSIHGND